MSSSRTGCLRFRADAAFCSLSSPCFRPTDVSRARRRFALFCAAFAAEPEVSSGWALPVVERGRGLGSLRRPVRYPVACASVNANVRLRSLLRRDGSSASATDGSGSFQFRAGARTGSRAVAGRAVAGADILHSGRSALSAGKRPQDARGRGRRCFTFPVVRRDLRDATPGRAMRLATPSRRKAAFSGALRRTR